jgi:hypothetical protein
MTRNNVKKYKMEKILGITYMVEEFISTQKGQTFWIGPCAIPR